MIIRPGYNVEIVRHRGSFILDRQIARAPIKFDGNARFMVDSDGITFKIPNGGFIEIQEEGSYRGPDFQIEGKEF